MLSDVQLQLLQWAGKGYCCSQILVGMALEFTGTDNPQLLRAAEALCNGSGSCEGVCGLLTGGSLVLGLHAGHLADLEEKDDQLDALLQGFTDWFTEHTSAKHGAITCGAILSGDCATATPDTSKCADLLHETYLQLESLLIEYNYDLAEIKK